MFLLLLIEAFARSSLASRVSYFGRTHGTASMGCFKRGVPPCRAAAEVGTISGHRRAS